MDITNQKLLKFKGLLFLLLGIISGGMILVYMPDWKIFLLLTICIWAFCRFYYFAFYVLERYADPTFRYSGLLDLAKYLITFKRK